MQGIAVTKNLAKTLARRNLVVFRLLNQVLKNGKFDGKYLDDAKRFFFTNT